MFSRQEVFYIIRETKSLKYLIRFNIYLMRLKLFEEYNPNDEYYWKIKKTEFDDRNDYREKFNEKELEKILSFFPKNDYCIYTLLKDVISVSIQKVYNITFTKSNDEWYLISHFSMEYFAREYNHNYYKCDQFDGLLRWLTDFKNEFK